MMIKFLIFITRREKRPFVGVVVEVRNHQFYAPLTSPKPKHLKMKNAIDFLKIDEGKLGAINFNNMIPIHDKFLTKIIPVISKGFSKDALAYNSMLIDQLDWCNKHREEIRKIAQKLYYGYVNKSIRREVLDRCCDFVLLEEKMEEYLKLH